MVENRAGKQMQPHATLRNLCNNSRFYVLAGTLLIALGLAAALRLAIDDSQLYVIRLEQLYGFMAIAYWYAALLISPLSKLWSTSRAMAFLTFTRRGIGVSAAGLACAHLVVALWGQLGGLGSLGLLPSQFIWALLLGIFATLVLLVMAATSFDKVVKFMTYRRWKLLHRLGYLGGIAVILHVWLIGTHIEYSAVQIAAFVALIILFGLEAWRLAKALSGRYSLMQKDVLVTVTVCIWIMLSGALYLVPSLIAPYHGERRTAQPGQPSLHIHGGTR